MTSKAYTVDSIEQDVPDSQCVQNGTGTHCDKEYSTHYAGDIADQQVVTSRSVNGADVKDDVTRPIIVTGFGGILRGDSNLSTNVMQEFYRTNAGYVDYKSEQIPIQTGSPDMMKDHDNLQPVETSYRFVTTPPFDPWLKSTNARLAVHLGTNDDAKDHEIWFELQACNGGAKFWTADDYGTLCYGEECIPGGCQYLQTSFDIPTLIKNVKEKVSNTTSISGIDFTFRESNNAGKFLCDFLYYRSLYYATQRGNGARNVIFIHIPPAGNLSSDVTAVDFALVLEQIVYCLLDMCSSESERETTSLPRTIENGGNEKLTNGVENQDKESCACKEALALPQNGCNKQALSSCYNQTPCTADQVNLRNQQEVISHPLKQMTVIENAVVITGFDPILTKPNQSWIIVQKFCSLFQQKDGKIEHNSIPFQLMTGPLDRPNQPITTTYDYVTSPDFDNWLNNLSNALLYVHLGTNDELNNQSGNTFIFETVAANGCDGYWTVDKKWNTFHRPCIEGGEDRLCTQFSNEQLSDLVSSLQDEVRNEKINGTFTFKQSTDAGHFLCNFLYYRSLYYATLRNKASSDGRKSYVIFIHVPSKLKPTNLAGVTPMALVLNLIVHHLLDIIIAP